MYKQYNANPCHNRVGDCVIRALSKCLNQTWDETYVGLLLQGFMMADMPSSNAVWGAYLRERDYTRDIIPTEYEGTYTVADFCNDHPHGKYLLALSGHVVAVEEGDYYDTWDSGDEMPVYYWYRRE